MELIKLRQQQQNTRAHLQAMEKRIKGTELKQKQMMNFLAKVMRNPSFMQRLVQQGRTKELEAALSKKRRLIDQGPKCTVDAQGEGTSVKIEPQDYNGDIAAFEVSELDKLAMDMQGLSKTGKTRVNEQVEEEGRKDRSGNEALDVEEIWEEFLNEELDEEDMTLLGAEGDEEEDVNLLVEQLSDLVSRDQNRDPSQGRTRPFWLAPMINYLFSFSVSIWGLPRAKQRPINFQKGFRCPQRESVRSPCSW